MATKPRFPTAERLHRMQLAIENTLAVPAIREAVELFGYGEERMAAGRALHSAASDAVNARVSTHAARKGVTRSVKEAKQEAFDAYLALARVARAVFARTPARLVALGLKGRMPRKPGPFMVAAYTLFENAAHEPVLAEFGYTEARLTAGREKIVAYETGTHDHVVAKAEAKEATRRQHEALDAMDAWLAQYRVIAQVALHGKQGLLTKLGIKVRGKRRKRRASDKGASKPEA
jgi:hypothetical protein